MNIISVLESTGLTKSESKVYVALLKIGSSTKKNIVRESGITPSKLYEITDKLIEKGLVSSVKQNNVLHFTAAPPEQILDFLERKKETISEKTRYFSSMLPQLRKIQPDDEMQVEVFKEWKGLRSAYRVLLNSMQPKETYYVIGASVGEDPIKVKKFFETIHVEKRNKKIISRMLVSNHNKTWAKKTLKNKTFDQVKFINNENPSEIVIWRNTVMIVNLTKIPVAVIIRDKYNASSFKNYFNSLWKQGTH